MGILRRLREWREDKDGTLIGPNIEADSVKTGDLETEVDGSTADEDVVNYQSDVGSDFADRTKITRDVSTSAVSVSQLSTQDGQQWGLVFVSGVDDSDQRFFDLVSVAGFFANSPPVTHSSGTAGAPTRSYSRSSDSELLLAVDSGTWDVRTRTLELGAVFWEA